MTNRASALKKIVIPILILVLALTTVLMLTACDGEDIDFSQIASIRLEDADSLTLLERDGFNPILEGAVLIVTFINGDETRVAVTYEMVEVVNMTTGIAFEIDAEEFKTSTGERYIVTSQDLIIRYQGFMLAALASFSSTNFINFNPNNTGLTVSSHSAPGANNAVLVIPSTHEGRTVNTIGTGALSNSPFGVVVMPNTLEMIESHAFNNSQNLNSIIFEGNSQLTTIAAGAFANLPNLRSIDIPLSVSSIATRQQFGNFVLALGAFCYNENLVAINIQEGSNYFANPSVESGFGGVVFQRSVLENGAQPNLTNYFIWPQGRRISYVTFIDRGNQILIQQGPASLPIAPPPLVAAGLELFGWYTEPQFISRIEEIRIQDEPLTLHARWGLERFFITYELNGGTNHANNPSYFNIESDFTLYAPKREGFYFTGWSNGGRIVAGTSTNQIFVANWEAITFTITYNLNGGINHANNPTAFTVLTSTIELLTPTKTGFDFIGWSPNAVIQQGSIGDRAFTANWIARNYSITYHLNAGINHADNPSEFTIESDEIILQAPTRHGFIFIGWSPSNVIASGSTGDKSFTAKWEATVYTITFNVNGGVNDLNNPSTFTIENSLTFNAPSRSGHTFVGWFADASLTVPFNYITLGTTGNLTVYASWSLLGFNIVYNLDGGINHPLNPFSFDVYSTITLMPATRQGYTFILWQNTVGDVVYSIELGTVEDIVLYAVWALNTYTVSFVSNGGAQDFSSIAFDIYSYTFYLPVNSKRGHTFDGWFNSANALVYRVTTGTAGDMILTASFTPIVYTLSFDFAGGAYVANATTFTVLTDTFALNASYKRGHTFDGWFNSLGYLVDSIEVGTIGDIHLTAKFTPIVFTISIDYNNGESAFNRSSFTVLTETFVLNPSFKRGHTFRYFVNQHGQVVFNVPQGTVGDIQLRAYFTAHQYQVYFNSNRPAHASYAMQGFTALSIHTFNVAKALSNNGFSLTGWTFLGWSLNPNASYAQFFDNQEMISVLDLNALSLYDYTIDGRVNLFAVWMANTFIITYNANGGLGTIPNSTHRFDAQADNSVYLNNNTFTREGFIFDGWSMMPNGLLAFANQANPGNLTAIDGLTIHLYARWTAITYTVVFNGNRHTSGNTANVTFTFNAFRANRVTTNGFSRIGHTFLGWARTANAITAEFNNESYVNVNLSSTQGDTITLFAVWQAITYTIMFNGNGATGTMGNQTVTFNAFTTRINANLFTRNGYRFLGWSRTPNATKEFTNNQLRNQNLASTQGAQVRLYAQWELIVYTITFATPAVINTFAPMGATHSSNPITFTIHQHVRLFAPTPNAGFEFVGWRMNNRNGTALVMQYYTPQSGDANIRSWRLPQGTFANVTLYPLFAALTYTITLDHAGGVFVVNGQNSHLHQTRTVEFGAQLPQPLPVPIWATGGRTFAGWFYYCASCDRRIQYTNASGNRLNRVDCNGLTTNRWTTPANKTLIAVWNDKTFTVTLRRNHTNTETTSLGSFSVTYGRPLSTTIARPSRDGFRFSGFYQIRFNNHNVATALTNNVRVIDRNMISNTVWNTPANANLYARWIAIEYIIAFSGRNTHDTAFFTVETTTSRSASNLEDHYHGRRFDGWNLPTGVTLNTATAVNGNSNFRSIPARMRLAGVNESWCSNRNRYVVRVTATAAHHSVDRPITGNATATAEWTRFNVPANSGNGNQRDFTIPSNINNVAFREEDAYRSFGNLRIIVQNRTAPLTIWLENFRFTTSRNFAPITTTGNFNLTIYFYRRNYIVGRYGSDNTTVGRVGTTPYVSGYAACCVPMRNTNWRAPTGNNRGGNAFTSAANLRGGNAPRAGTNGRPGGVGGTGGAGGAGQHAIQATNVFFARRSNSCTLTLQGGDGGRGGNGGQGGNGEGGQHGGVGGHGGWSYNVLWIAHGDGGSGSNGGRGGDAGHGGAGGAGGAGGRGVSGTIHTTNLGNVGVTNNNGSAGQSGAEGAHGIPGRGGQFGGGGAHGRNGGNWFANLLALPGGGLVGVIVSSTLPTNRGTDGSDGLGGWCWRRNARVTWNWEQNKPSN